MSGIEEEGLELTAGNVKKVMTEAQKKSYKFHNTGQDDSTIYKDAKVDDFYTLGEDGTPEFREEKVITFAKMDEEVKLFLGRTKNHKVGETKIPTKKMAVGAAGEYAPVWTEDILEMNDPYSAYARSLFSDAALTDPIVRTPLERRQNSFFANGFHLEAQPTSKRSDDGVLRDGEGQKMVIEELNHRPVITEALNMLEEWCAHTNINLLQRMKETVHVKTVQGRGLVRIKPSINELLPGKLPALLLPVSAEELGNVIINRRTHAILGVRYYSMIDGSGISTPGAMIYSSFHNTTLKRFEWGFGRSGLESLLTLSRVNRKIINFDYPKAVVAAFMPKVNIQVPVWGNAEQKRKQLDEHADHFANRDVTAIEASPMTQVTYNPLPTNNQLIDTIRKDINSIFYPALGTTRLKMGDTDNLTRDNAVIMEVEEKREIRTPDELSVSEFYEHQLLTPLLLHLIRFIQPKLAKEHIPIKCKIVRDPPDDETAMLEQKIMEGGGGSKGAKEEEGSQGGPMEEAGMEGNKPMTEQQPNQNPAGLGAAGSDDTLLDLPKDTRKLAMEYYDIFKDLGD